MTTSNAWNKAIQQDNWGKDCNEDLYEYKKGSFIAADNLILQVNVSYEIK